MRAITLVLLLIALSSTLALEIPFYEYNSFVVHYSNGTSMEIQTMISPPNERGNVDVYYDHGELVIEYPNGSNMTFWKPFVVDQGGNQESCNIACDGYSCSGHSIPSQGCSCGCTYCCYNGYTNAYYLCPSDSAACCHTGTSNYGCAVGPGCKNCDW